jgi:penicillin amidase
VEGFDLGKPAGIPPTEQQVTDSIATTIFHLWLSQLLKNTVDGVLDAISPRLPKPGNHDAVKALIHLLETFGERGGVGASGLPFFTVPGLEGAPPQIMRDIIILKSMVDALDLLASDAFASAYGGSRRLNDYRWGKIHRVIMRHIAQFGGPFDLPPEGESFPTDGGYQVPDRSDPNVRGSKAEDFRFRSGPSRRYAAELGPEEIRAFQVLPGGQSGVPGARHYGDQLSLWLTNAFHPLFTTRHEILENTETWQDFYPVSGGKR